MNGSDIISSLSAINSLLLYSMKDSYLSPPPPHPPHPKLQHPPFKRWTPSHPFGTIISSFEIEIASFSFCIFARLENGISILILACNFMPRIYLYHHKFPAPLPPLYWSTPLPLFISQPWHPNPICDYNRRFSTTFCFPTIICLFWFLLCSYSDLSMQFMVNQNFQNSLILSWLIS